METDLSYRIGQLLFRFRWWVIISFIFITLSCLPFIPRLIDPFKTVGLGDQYSESFKTSELLNQKFGSLSNRFLILYHDDTLKISDKKFVDDIKYSLSGLKNFPIEHTILSPLKNPKQIATAKHTAYAIVLFKSNVEADTHVVKLFKSALNKPKNISMLLGGEPVFTDDARHQSQVDLYRAEYIAAPAAIITLLFAFGSVIAASIPVIVGVIGLLISVVLLYFLGHLFDLSIFTLNITLFMGLCLCLDYSLLIVSRFREQLKLGETPKVAIGITQATAGKAVFFSGIVVLISLSALLLFHTNILWSVGIGGITTVLVAVVMANILLPAVLSVLGEKINFLSLKSQNHVKPVKDSRWYRVFNTLKRYPFLFFILSLTFLIFLGSPILNANVSIADPKILPPHLDSAKAYALFKKSFGENELTPIYVVAHSPNGKILSENNINNLYDFAQTIKDDNATKRVVSIVTNPPGLTKKQLVKVYEKPNKIDSRLEEQLKLSTKNDMTVMTIFSRYGTHSPETESLVDKIRRTRSSNGMTYRATGITATSIDVTKNIKHTLLYAALWIFITSYLILLILFRSIILPIKAIVMNLLSLLACYGALVFVFQEGHFSHLLNFVPLGYTEITLLIIIFCSLFGISMDYEVFMLTRIKEEYEQSKDNNDSVITGTIHSSKIITSAAIIVIAICLSFITADIIIVKAIGLGIAIAVFVDAFIVRTLLVPSTMYLLKDWNWYLPNWLDRILPKIKFH